MLGRAVAARRPLAQHHCRMRRADAIRGCAAGRTTLAGAIRETHLVRCSPRRKRLLNELLHLEQRILRLALPRAAPPQKQRYERTAREEQRCWPAEHAHRRIVLPLRRVQSQKAAP
eukprot:7352136-Prymnesium_polylepis.3